MANIISVWSSYGHRFIGDGDDHQICLTCGAVYELAPAIDEPTVGFYVAANGDNPQQCTRRTDMSHGYPGERVDGWTDHDCNCLLCR